MLGLRVSQDKLLARAGQGLADSRGGATQYGQHIILMLRWPGQKVNFGVMKWHMSPIGLTKRPTVPISLKASLMAFKEQLHNQKHDDGPALEIRTLVSQAPFKEQTWLKMRSTTL